MVILRCEKKLCMLLTIPHAYVLSVSLCAYMMSVT